MIIQRTISVMLLLLMLHYLATDKELIAAVLLLCSLMSEALAELKGARDDARDP